MLAATEVQIGPKRRDRVEGPVCLIEKWTGSILRDIMILILDASSRAIQNGLPHLPLDLLATTWQDIQTHQVTDFLRLSRRNGRSQ
jgi:hypothetical protein